MIKALTVPVIFVNIVSSFVAIIWLIFLKDWHVIVVGVGLLLFGAYLVSFAMMPSLLLDVPGIKLIDRGNRIMGYIFATVAAIYDSLILTIWSAGIMIYFYSGSPAGHEIPRVLWAYGVSMGVLRFIAEKEADPGELNYTGMVTSLAQISLVVLIPLILFTQIHPVLFGLLLGGVLFLGRMALAVISHRNA